MPEIKTVLIHIRWRLQTFTSLGFLFGLVILDIPLSMVVIVSFVSWLLLASGLTVFNSYYDKDIEPVAGLELPPPVNTSMIIGAWSMKTLGLLLALIINNKFLLLYLLIVILSVLYSHKRFRLKSNGYVAVFFNIVMGISTFLAVSTLTNAPNVLILFGCSSSGLFLGAIYLAMQIHQSKDDYERGDISLTVMYGKNTVKRIAFVLSLIAAICTITTFYISWIDTSYIIISVLYFCGVLIYIVAWFKNHSSEMNEFKFMNTMTLLFSYTGNILLSMIHGLQQLQIL